MQTFQNAPSSPTMASPRISIPPMHLMDRDYCKPPKNSPTSKAAQKRPFEEDDPQPSSKKQNSGFSEMEKSAVPVKPNPSPPPKSSCLKWCPMAWAPDNVARVLDSFKKRTLTHNTGVQVSQVPQKGYDYLLDELYNPYRQFVSPDGNTHFATRSVNKQLGWREFDLFPGYEYED